MANEEMSCLSSMYRWAGNPARVPGSAAANQARSGVGIFRELFELPGENHANAEENSVPLMNLENIPICFCFCLGQRAAK